MLFPGMSDRTRTTHLSFQQQAVYAPENTQAADRHRRHSPGYHDGKTDNATGTTAQAPPPQLKPGSLLSGLLQTAAEIPKSATVSGTDSVLSARDGNVRTWLSLPGKPCHLVC